MSTDIKTCEELLAYVDDIAENAMTTQQYKTIADGISKIKKSFDEKQPEYYRVDYVKNEVVFDDGGSSLNSEFCSGIFKKYNSEENKFNTTLNRRNLIPSHIIDKFESGDWVGGYFFYKEEISVDENIIILKILKL